MANQLKNLPTQRSLLSVLVTEDIVDFTKAKIEEVENAMLAEKYMLLLETLRSMAECDNCHVPVIMMSTAPDSARIAAARDAGITEFLRKPFAAQHLATRLESILAAPRQFIANDAYAGPDRRRKKLETKGPERRSGS